MGRVAPVEQELHEVNSLPSSCRTLHARRTLWVTGCSLQALSGRGLVSSLKCPGCPALHAWLCTA